MCVSAAVGGSVRAKWLTCDFSASDPLEISPCDLTLPSFPLEARFGYDVVGVYTFRCLALLPRPDRALL